MYCNQIFSLINDGEIQNIIVASDYETASNIARFTFGDDAIAVDTTLYPVAIGDTYTGGKFYRDGIEIERNLSEAEHIRSLQAQCEEILLTEADMLIDISMLQLEL